MDNNSKQKKRPGLSFLTLAFIIAIISIFVFYIILGDSEENPATVKVNNYIVPAPGAIYDYLIYVEEFDIAKSGINDYTARSLKLLSGALTELVNFEQIKDVEIIAERNKLLTASDYILINPEAENVPDSIKHAFQIASQILVYIQEENFPELSSLSKNVVAASRAFNPNNPLVDQKEQIQLFFKETADIIENMALIRSQK
ncbi:MAG: hypothetical protein M3Q58_08505 [Bacteroidota bacterium]|nr:hypothetical protein [Bacteroidota bacterium]